MAKRVARGIFVTVYILQNVSSAAPVAGKRLLRKTTCVYIENQWRERNQYRFPRTICVLPIRTICFFLFFWERIKYIKGWILKSTGFSHAALPGTSYAVGWVDIGTKVPLNVVVYLKKVVNIT
jgi:hypothetical protein